MIKNLICLSIIIIFILFSFQKREPLPIEQVDVVQRYEEVRKRNSVMPLKMEDSIAASGDAAVGTVYVSKSFSNCHDLDSMTACSNMSGCSVADGAACSGTYGVR